MQKFTERRNKSIYLGLCAHFAHMTKQMWRVAVYEILAFNRSVFLLAVNYEDGKEKKKSVAALNHGRQYKTKEATIRRSRL